MMASTNEIGKLNEAALKRKLKLEALRNKNKNKQQQEGEGRRAIIQKGQGRFTQVIITLLLYYCTTIY